MLIRSHDCWHLGGSPDGILCIESVGDSFTAKGSRNVLLKIKSSQKFFTEEEVSRLTGICLDHLRSLARSKHLGFISRAAEAAGAQAEKWLFTNSDLMILSVLYTRCQH